MITEKNEQTSIDLDETTSENEDFFVVWQNKEGVLERGPLQILWELIESYKVDILNVSLERLTKDFLIYLNQCKNLSLENAAAFMHTASRLLYYKSKSLLPVEQDFENDEEDYTRLPKELVQQLLEYRKFQNAALKLQEYESISNSMYVKPFLENSNKEVKELSKNNIEYIDLNLNDLIIVYSKLLQRISKEEEQNKEKLSYELEQYTVEEKCKYLEDLLETVDSFIFEELFEDPKQIKIPELIASFLALLELTRKHKIILRQKSNFDEIHIFKKETLLHK